MKKVSKKFVFSIISIGIIFISVLFVLYICNSNILKKEDIILESNYNDLFTSDELMSNGNIELLSQYNADAAVAYKNIDGKTHLYVYANPIRFEDLDGSLKFIDTRIKNVEENAGWNSKYIYTVSENDIIPLYPEKLNDDFGVKLVKDISYEFGSYYESVNYADYIEDENFIGEVKNMIEYKDAFGEGINLKCYPSNIGTNCEIEFNKDYNKSLDLWLKLEDGLNAEVSNGGYIIIFDNQSNSIDGVNEKNILGIIQPPIIKDNSGGILYDNSIELKLDDKENTYKLTFNFSQEVKCSSTMYFSAEMRRFKQPDTTLYSGKPNLTYSYLLNHAVIGKDEKKSIGRHLIRFLFCDMFNIKKEEIEDVKFSMYSLSEKENVFLMNTVEEGWCSLLDNWNSNIEIGDSVSKAISKNHIIEFDLTEETKEWCDVKSVKNEQFGLLLSLDKEDDYNVILSNDNALFNNRVEVILNR